MDPLKIYDYLIQTRERVFDAVRPLTPEQYRREFRIGLKSIASTLTHLMISEWYYIERLEQRDVPHYETWPIKYENPPTFDVVESIWRKQAQQIRGLVAARPHDGWSRKITWLSFPDDTRGNKRFSNHLHRRRPVHANSPCTKCTTARSSWRCCAKSIPRGRWKIWITTH